MNTMNTKQRLVQSGRVTTEGDELYYEVHGQGQPFLMIPAGGGDGNFYAAVYHLRIIHQLSGAARNWSTTCVSSCALVISPRCPSWKM
jgi:hypothetical protein